MPTDTEPMRVRVASIAQEAADIRSFELVAEDGRALPAFSAGAHVDVHLPDGLTRQYSLCNDPQENQRYLIAVLRDPLGRGGSVAMHDSVRVGDSLSISAPKNHFRLEASAGRHLLLAGGIGVTPILSMAEQLAASQARFEMHYCTRSIERTAFRDRIAQSRFAAHVAHHFDDGDPAQRLDIASRLKHPDADTHLYVCGPSGFMIAVLDGARAAGWPEARLHYEFFAGDATPKAGEASFEVQLVSSGRVILVPGDQTVTQALASAGCALPTSCEQGVCGTCVTRVLSGEPDHRDFYLTPEEQQRNDQFVPCCSRAKSRRLVLDI